MDSTVTCADCGSANVDEIRSPCPECGSTRRNWSLHLEIGAYSITPNDVGFVVSEYHEVLVDFARNLVNQSPYGIAIVVAHMACEMAVERVISKFTGGAPENAGLYSYNLRHDNNRKKYTALTGDEIQRESFWQKFKESAERRNSVVHKRHVATLEEARESLNAVESLIKHLKQKHNMPWN